MSRRTVNAISATILAAAVVAGVACHKRAWIETAVEQSTLTARVARSNRALPSSSVKEGDEWPSKSHANVPTVTASTRSNGDPTTAEQSAPVVVGATTANGVTSQSLRRNDLRSDEWPDHRPSTSHGASVPNAAATALTFPVMESAINANATNTATIGTATKRLATSLDLTPDPRATAGLVPSPVPLFAATAISMARMRPTTPPEIAYPAVCTLDDIALTKRMAAYAGYEYMGLGLITRVRPLTDQQGSPTIPPPLPLPATIAPCEIMYAYHHQPLNAIVWWVPDFLADLGYESPSATCTITVPIERDAGDVPRRNSVTVVIDGKEYDREVGATCKQCDQVIEVPCVNMQRTALTVTYEWRTVISRSKVIEVK